MSGQLASDALLLKAWEHGAALAFPARALALLALLDAPDAAEDLWQLSIGRRDARLLALRERLFGTQAACTADCPVCATMLEFDLSIADLLALAAADVPLTVASDGFCIHFRLPCSADFAPTAPADAAQLLARCLTAIDRPAGAAEPPPHLLQAVVEQMARADPLADLQLELICPACAASWQAPFDSARFVWREIDSWARQTLRDIHTLATAYGWREADILALSRPRREVYLQLVRDA
ncbi:MAG TPA: hypothetical protein PKA05_15875 [Roseiflexaceae bacterium]|nr:hypothetical protein [Roseiflexaceae bacterium]